MPWLIGIILALAGIVIVLLALIFSSPGGLVASDPTGTPQPSGSGQPGGGVVPSTDPSVSANASPSAPEETPQPTAQEPAFGPLEMTYLGRPSAVAPIYLLIRDFSVAKDPDVLAQADQGVSSYANAPDGRVSAAIINGRAVALSGREEVTTPGRQRQHAHLRLGRRDAVRGAHHQGRRRRPGQDPGDRLRQRRHQAAHHHRLPAPGDRCGAAAQRGAVHRQRRPGAPVRGGRRQPDAVGAGCAGHLPDRSGQRRRDRDRARSRSCGRPTARIG